MARRRRTPPATLFPFPFSTAISKRSTSLMTPWQPVFADAALVIPMRLALLPWLMLTDPRAGRRESHLMVDEKKEAFGEALASLWLAPFRYWSGLATLSVAPGTRGLERSFAEASRHAAQPYARRVRGNRRRLAGGGVRST